MNSWASPTACTYLVVIGGPVSRMGPANTEGRMRLMSAPSYI